MSCAYLRRMSIVNELAEVGALIGDPVRAKMLSLFFDGRAHTATELATEAGVTPQTASWHLSNLTSGRLLTSEKQGRYRLFRFASPLVAQMLETALVVAASGPRRHKPQSQQDAALRMARTCYDHIAGKLGVAMTSALVRRHYLHLSRDGGELTPAGVRMLGDFGIDLGAAARRKRIFCRPCLDWTERRPHLAGAVGAAIADRCFELDWIESAPDSRVISITNAGQTGFSEVFGVTL
jgi:DNA-binding transcriptional ArsR family regulator